MILLQQQPQNPSDRLTWADQLPPAASTFCPDTDGLFWFVTYVSIFFFVLITAILVYAVVKWHRRTEDQPAASNVTHNTALEVTWTVIPLIIVMVIFVWGWKGAQDQTIAPATNLNYKVVGYQWGWEITHPGSTEPVAELWVPKDRPVKLTMSSRDVLHSFFIPAFRVKRDVIPGRYQTLWFQATRKGVYDVFCAEYCGTKHSQMILQDGVHVVDYEEWLKRPWEKESADPKERGKKTWTNQCKTCHTIDGTPSVGPTWLGLSTRELEWTDGTKGKFTRDHLKESLAEPGKKLAKGFPNGGMTPFPDITKNDKKLDDLMEFIQSLK